MKEVIKLLPKENIIYFADTANLPYGSKSPRTIISLTMKNIHFLIEEKKVKLLIIACHTATAYTLEAAQKKYPSTPILGIIASGVEELIKHTKTSSGVIGTRATIASGIYKNLVKKLSPSLKVYFQACPLLVNLVEEGFIFNRITTLTLEKYLKPLKQKNITSLLLACTHFPLLSKALKSYLKGIKIIDPAMAVAEKAKELLASNDLLSSQQKGIYRYFVTDDPIKFKRMGQKFLKIKIGQVEEK